MAGRLRHLGEAAIATSPPPGANPANHLRSVAIRLAAELDRARLYQAAAYASMIADSLNESCEGALNDNDMRTDVELEFELDEHGRVWMIREGDCHIIGRTNAVCAEMRRFLTRVVLGDDR